MMQTIQAIFGLVVMLQVFYYFIMLFLRCAGIVKWEPVPEPQSEQQTQPYEPVKKKKQISKKAQPLINPVNQSQKVLNSCSKIPESLLFENLDNTRYPDMKISSLESTWKDELRFLNQSATSPTKSDREATPPILDYSLAEIKLAMNFQDDYDLQVLHKIEEIRQLKEIIKCEDKVEFQKQVNMTLKQILPQIIQQQSEELKQQKPKKQKKKKSA